MSEFPNCEIKLCDLEVSRVIRDNEEIRQLIGTPDYVGQSFIITITISIDMDLGNDQSDNDQQ